MRLLLSEKIVPLRQNIAIRVPGITRKCHETFCWSTATPSFQSNGFTEFPNSSAQCCQESFFVNRFTIQSDRALFSIQRLDPKPCVETIFEESLTQWSEVQTFVMWQVILRNKCSLNMLVMGNQKSVATFPNFIEGPQHVFIVLIASTR